MELWAVGWKFVEKVHWINAKVNNITRNVKGKRLMLQVQWVEVCFQQTAKSLLPIFFFSSIYLSLCPSFCLFTSTPFFLGGFFPARHHWIGMWASSWSFWPLRSCRSFSVPWPFSGRSSSCGCLSALPSGGPKPLCVWRRTGKFPFLCPPTRCCPSCLRFAEGPAGTDTDESSSCFLGRKDKHKHRKLVGVAFFAGGYLVIKGCNLSQKLASFLLAQVRGNVGEGKESFSFSIYLQKWCHLYLLPTP